MSHPALCEAPARHRAQRTTDGRRDIPATSADLRAWGSRSRGLILTPPGSGTVRVELGLTTHTTAGCLGVRHGSCYRTGRAQRDPGDSPSCAPSTPDRARPRPSGRASTAAKPCEAQKPPPSSESVADGVGRCFGAVARADLGVGVVEVTLDGVDAEYELLGDLPVGQPRGNESQHFRLTTRQTVRQTPARTPE